MFTGKSSASADKKDLDGFAALKIFEENLTDSQIRFEFNRKSVIVLSLEFNPDTLVMHKVVTGNVLFE